MYLIMQGYQNEHMTMFASKAEERYIFFLVFVGVLALTYGFLFLIDFLPQKPSAVTSDKNSQVSLETVFTAGEDSDPITHSDTRIDIGVDSESVDTRSGEDDAVNALSERGGVIDPYPTRIIFDTLGDRTITVLNPSARSIEALDTALLSGVVRHPDSADFERTGTIFLFGHSSYLPNVMNKNFQAFNGIQKLTWGDTIRLHSSDTEYVYRVDRVYEASANDAEVKIEAGKAKLTLVTCDSFGAKSDRFVVEATLIRENAL